MGQCGVRPERIGKIRRGIITDFILNQPEKNPAVILMILFLQKYRCVTNSVLPEDVQACVLLQSFSQTTSTPRRDIVGRETEENMPLSVCISEVQRNVSDVRLT